MMMKDAIRWNIDIAASRISCSNSNLPFAGGSLLMQINGKLFTEDGRGIFGRAEDAVRGQT